MRNSRLLLILCLGGFLLGCSSKPGTSDIMTGLNDFWAGCAKISDVTKTNGVENVNSYRVSFTYKLELLEDGAGMLGTPPGCSISGAANQAGALFKIAVLSASSGGGSLKKGDVYTVSNGTNMVKSEKGWIFQ